MSSIIHPTARKSLWQDANFRRDLVKLVCVLVAICGTSYLFVLNPALSTPTLFSIGVSMLLSPLVARLERRGYPRSLAIVVVFLTIGLSSVLVSFWAMQSGEIQWNSLKEKAPAYFDATIQKLKTYETGIKDRYPFLRAVNPVNSLVTWGKNTGHWFVSNGASLVGEILTWLFIVPLLTFFMLNDGPSLQKRFFQLVPNRYFEITFGVVNEITTSISDYLRAKMVEALLMAVMVTVGLALFDAPYAIVLGVVAGVTNIIPYLGPVLGAIPGLLIASLDTTTPNLIWLVLAVYLIANIIDSVLIFPVIVAKLVDLHPMILIVAVIIGQQYYGLIGMLISIPIASAIKVVMTQIYRAVYGQRRLS